MTRYLRPASLADAVAGLDVDGSVQLLAGGTDLVNEIRLRLLYPDVVVDTADLAELHALDTEAAAGTVRIGAGVTMSALLTAPWHGRLAALTDAADLLGGRQIQAVATLGGNVCHASPAAETATPLLVHDAVLRIVGPDGDRDLPVSGLWTGPRRTALARGELLVEIRIPAAAAGWASAYRRLELRKSVDIALVSASAALDVGPDGAIRAARVAIGAAGPVPFLVPAAEAALAGVAVRLDGSGPAAYFAAAVEAAADAAAAASRPIDDVRSTAAYRRAMVRVVARRALVAAAVRSQSEERP